MADDVYMNKKHLGSETIEFIADNFAKKKKRSWRQLLIHREKKNWINIFSFHFRPRASLFACCIILSDGYTLHVCEWRWSDAATHSPRRSRPRVNKIKLPFPFSISLLDSIGKKWIEKQSEANVCEDILCLDSK